MQFGICQAGELPANVDLHLLHQLIVCLEACVEIGEPLTAVLSHLEECGYGQVYGYIWISFGLSVDHERFDTPEQLDDVAVVLNFQPNLKSL